MPQFSAANGGTKRTEQNGNEAALSDFHCNIDCKNAPERYVIPVVYPGIFFVGGGVQQIQLRTEDREDRDLGAVAP